MYYCRSNFSRHLPPNSDALTQHCLRWIWWGWMSERVFRMCKSFTKLHYISVDAVRIHFSSLCSRFLCLIHFALLIVEQLFLSKSCFMRKVTGRQTDRQIDMRHDQVPITTAELNFSNKVSTKLWNRIECPSKWIIWPLFSFIFFDSISVVSVLFFINRRRKLSQNMGENNR